MNHETGKSRKLNDDDMMQMQTLASDILLMERGQSKAVTGKEHLERNDFIIEKQKAELQRMDAAKRHKEEQINLAEQELKQVKSEIRTDKLKKTATTAATAITSGVASLFGSGKLKEHGTCQRKNCKTRFQNGTPILKNCRAKYSRCRNSMIRKSTISEKCTGRNLT